MRKSTPTRRAALPVLIEVVAQNCINRERVFLVGSYRSSLSHHFWFSLAAVLGTPRRKACAPRYAPNLESIKATTLTDQYYVARNLTWDECEKLMGFPEGWTVSEGDSLVTQ